MCILPYDYSIGFYLYHLFWILTAVRDWSGKVCCNSALKGLANGRFIFAQMWHGIITGGAVHQLFPKQAYLQRGHPLVQHDVQC